MRATQRMSRLLSASLAIALALVCALSAASCGSKGSEEELVEATVTEALEGFKNPSNETLAPYISDDDPVIKSVENYDEDIYTFIGNCFQHFDYTIDSLKVNGERARVGVTFTNADISKAMEEAAQELEGRKDEMLKLYQSGDDGLNKVMQEYLKVFYKKVEASDETVTNAASLTLTKKEGEWEIDEDSIFELTSGLFADMELML